MLISIVSAQDILFTRNFKTKVLRFIIYDPQVCVLFAILPLSHMCFSNYVSLSDHYE